MVSKTVAVIVWTSAFFLLVAAAAAGEPTIAIRQGGAGVFGGEEITYRVDAASVRPIGRTLAWRLAAGSRTLQAGEMAPQGGELRLSVPEVKEGAVVDLRLEFAILPAEGDKPSATAQRIVHVYPRNPFAGRKRSLESIDLHVFDPDGRVTKALKSLDVPFKAVPRESMIPGIESGTLLVGEGVSWDEYRSLVPDMLDAAARGVAVVCLAPSDGTMRLPVAADGSASTPVELRLRQGDIVRELDKRLDVAEWPEKKCVLAKAIRIVAEKGQVVAEITDDAAEWPWLEVGFAAPGARLVVSTFPIADAWETAPTPRVLLLRLLEYVAEPKTMKENEP